MRYGKVSQAVLDRSVLRPLCRSGSMDERVNRMCSVKLGSVGKPWNLTPEMILAGTINDLIARTWAQTGDVQIETGILCPQDFPEEHLKELICRLGTFCHLSGITLSGGHTQVSPAVLSPVLSVSAYVSCVPGISAQAAVVNTPGECSSTVREGEGIVESPAECCSTAREGTAESPAECSTSAQKDTVESPAECSTSAREGEGIVESPAECSSSVQASPAAISSGSGSVSGNMTKRTILGSSAQAAAANCHTQDRDPDTQGGRNSSLSDICGKDTGCHPGQLLLMTGYAGWAGTSVLASDGAGELKKRFPAVFTEEARQFARYLLMEDVMMVLRAEREKTPHNSICLQDISQGGVFASLWEMSQRGGTGLDVDIRKIPIRQETVEICEYYDLNPYQLYGCGGMLIAADPGNGIQEALQNKGIRCSVIGSITKGPARILRNGEEIRYLDKPAQDMLDVMQERNMPKIQAD